MEPSRLPPPTGGMYDLRDPLDAPDDDPRAFQPPDPARPFPLSWAFSRIPQGLHQFLDLGIPLLPMADKQPLVKKWGNGDQPVESAFSADPLVIQAQIYHYIGHHKHFWAEQFAFIPKLAGFIVLDLDEKDGKSGSRSLLLACQRHGIVLPFDMEKHPARTRTPSGGHHFYFRYTGDALRTRCGVFSGVDLIYNSLIIAPGSITHIREGELPVAYEFTGRLSDAPPFPYALKRLFGGEIEGQRNAEKKAQSVIYRKLSGITSKDPLAALRAIEASVNNGHPPEPGRRHDYCFTFSRLARDNGVEPDSTVSFLSKHEQPGLSMRDIQSTVNSTYNWEGGKNRE